MSIIRRTLRAMAGVILVATLASARNPKIAPDLEAVDPNSTIDVIVQFSQVPTERHHQKVRSRGGSLRTKLDLVKGGAYTIPASALEDLATDPRSFIFRRIAW